MRYGGFISRFVLHKNVLVCAVSIDKYCMPRTLLKASNGIGITGNMDNI